jgi:ABC-type phosphate/phosphonate transport system substrate-binding protein
MSRMWFALLFTGLIGLTACQPQEIVLEVTRIVEIQKAEVEVTPVVPQTVVQEVTRMVTEEVIVEVTKSPLGTEARPIQLLFWPAVDTAVIDRRGPILAQALADVTGYEFAVSVLDDEQTVIDLMCAAPLETIGFLSPAAYVLAAEQCGAQAGSVAVNNDGLTWQSGMIVTRRDSGLDTLADLEGKSWAVADTDSIAKFLYFQALLQEEGVEPGHIVEVSGDSAAMLAVYDEEADFATAEFVPPIMPYEESLWDYGEDTPEPGRYLGIPPTRSPIGYVLVNGEPEYGGYRLRDARSRIFDFVPQIYDRTQIVTLSAQIPNEMVAFGHDFPLGIARQVTMTLAELAASEDCKDSLCATDFYNWTGLLPADEQIFTPIGFMQETLDLSADEMLELTR